jgi:protein O-mannosyl-transferase
MGALRAMATVEPSKASSAVRLGFARDREPITPAKIGLMLGLLGFLAFVPTLGNDFVAWDDPDNFIDNIGFRGIGLRNIRWAWTTMIIGVYQPIAWMLLEIEYLFTGLNPYGYHLASALMHGLNTLVLFYLALALIHRGRPELAGENQPRLLLTTGLSVALWAVHPMRTEVVAWASAQPYLPCAFFSMLSVLAYLKANPIEGGPVRSRWLLITFLLYAAAVLSKAAAIPLPAVFLVLDVYPLRRLTQKGWWNTSNRRLVFEKMPFFVLCAVFMAAAVLARVYDRNLDPIGNTGISGRITLTCYSVIFYPLKSLWPFDLHAFYMRPRWANLFGAKFLLAVAGTTVVSGLLILNRRRKPGMLAAWAVYLLILAPVSGVVTTGMQVAADRYGYLTMMAFVAPLAVGLCELARRFEGYRFARPAQCLGGFALALVLISLTFIQCRTWKDSEALWANGIEHGAGHVADLHNNLGAVWASKGHYDLAIFAFGEALRLKPSLRAAQDNMDKAIANRAKQAKPRTKKPA